MINGEWQALKRESGDSSRGAAARTAWELRDEGLKEDETNSIMS